MTLHLAVAVVHGIVAGGALVLVGLLAGRGQARTRPWLVWLLVAVALYAFGYALELSGDTVAWVLATFRLQHLAIAFAPTLMLLLAGDLGVLPLARAPAVRWAAVALSTVSYVLVVTGPGHGLYHVDPVMVDTGPFPVIHLGRGSWYYVQNLYAVVALVTVGAALARQARRTRGFERERALVLGVAVLVPLVGAVLNLTGWVPWGLDPAPLALAGSVALLYVGVTRYAIADVRPVARDLVVEQLGDAVLVLDLADRVVDANPVARRLLDAAGDAARMRPPVDLPPGEHWSVTVADRVLDGRSADLADRRGRPLGRVLVLRDISRQAELEARLRVLATTDDLTGLANRRHFLDLVARDVARARRSGQPLAVAVIDLDRFKSVNDTHGHATGDAVLRAVARALEEGTRREDLVARYGGEEFAVALLDAGAADAARAGERLRAAVAAVRVAAVRVAAVRVAADPASRARGGGGRGADAARVAVTGSVGMALAAGGEVDLEHLLRRADAALYRAKAAGGDTVVVDAGG